MKSTCPWCASDSDVDTDEDLCLMHRAEFHGTTAEQLEQIEADSFREERLFALQTTEIGWMEHD